MSVTVPSLPIDCTSTSDDRDVEWLEACKPTLTASVYLNSTSPTGRTLDIQNLI